MSGRTIRGISGGYPARTSGELPADPTWRQGFGTYIHFVACISASCWASSTIPSCSNSNALVLSRTKWFSNPSTIELIGLIKLQTHGLSFQQPREGETMRTPEVKHESNNSNTGCSCFLPYRILFSLPGRNYCTLCSILHLFIVLHRMLQYLCVSL